MRRWRLCENRLARLPLRFAEDVVANFVERERWRQAIGDTLHPGDNRRPGGSSESFFLQPPSATIARTAKRDRRRSRRMAPKGRPGARLARMREERALCARRIAISSNCRGLLNARDSPVGSNDFGVHTTTQKTAKKWKRERERMYRSMRNSASTSLRKGASDVGCRERGGRKRSEA